MRSPSGTRPGASLLSLQQGCDPQSTVSKARLIFGCTRTAPEMCRNTWSALRGREREKTGHLKSPRAPCHMGTWQDLTRELWSDWV